MENILFYSPDIRQLVHNVNIGPQAEVTELINEFNTSYIIRESHHNRSYHLQTGGKELAITKKFYWKPGSYDIIKDVIWHQSEMHKKAASLFKVVDRTKVNGHWRLRAILNQIGAIEKILYDFRNRGIIQQDNTDDAVEAWNILRNHLIEQFQACNGVFTIYVEDDYDERETLKDYFINVVYEYNDVKINYRHHENPNTLAEILLPGEGHITVKMSLTKLLNEIILVKMDLTKIPLNKVLSRRHNNHNWFYNIGGNYETFDGLQHPYISSHGSYYNNNNHQEDFKYVCVGNLETEIKGCIQSFDFISLKVFFDRMMTHYDTQTGPLNRIDMCYHGQPDFLKGADEYYKINPPKESNNCRYWEYLENDEPEYIREESYCAKFCTLKDTCSAYKAISKTLTKEDLERRALEQATINAARRVQ